MCYIRQDLQMLIHAKIVKKETCDSQQVVMKTDLLHHARYGHFFPAFDADA